MFGQTIPKDWLEKDYQTDSVAGISLDKGRYLGELTQTEVKKN
jgi:hypothetical protein